MCLYFGPLYLGSEDVSGEMTLVLILTFNGNLTETALLWTGK